MEELTIRSARILCGELILCLSEVSRLAADRSRYPRDIAAGLGRILAIWDGYGERLMNLPGMRLSAPDEGIGFSRAAIVHDADEALRSLMSLYTAMREVDADMPVTDIREVKAPLVVGLLCVRQLRNMTCIREAVDALLAEPSHAS